MTERMQICLSGRVSVRCGGTDRELGGHHPRALLAYLTTERHSVASRDELADALWGHELPGSWQASLRVSLSKVRAFLVGAGLSADALRSNVGGYQLHLDRPVEVDVEGALHDLEAAERALRAGDLVTACEGATAARSVFAATLVPGAGGPWIEDRRRAATVLLMRALETEAEALSSRGEWAAAVAAAQQAVALDPFQESAHRALIRALAGAGNKGEALLSYERCRRVLSEELGVDPSPATQAVHLQVLHDEPLHPAAAGAPPVVEQTVRSLLEAGRAALAGRRWSDASDLLTRADAERPLGPHDLESLAEACLWCGRHDDSVSARRRAYAAFLESGDSRAAARVALALASNHGIRSQLAVAEGWFRTAARLLEGETEGPEQGFLAFVAAMVLFDSGLLTESLEQAQRAFDAGRRFHIPDLEAVGIVLQGLVLARQDRVVEAVPLLDEGMARATSGALTPLMTGLIYCRTIRTWLDLFDFRRAAEWIETIERCATATGFAGYAGDCHAHLSAALVARGSWREAERVALRACEECDTFELSHVGLASYTLGEIHLRRGDLELAATAFQRANEHGITPQPGLASLQLARGDATGALASVRAYLEGTSIPLQRAAVLPTAIELAISVGALDSATSATDELTVIAKTYGSAALVAAAARARGSIALTGEGLGEALHELHAAIEHYRKAELPYEVARTKTLLAEALAGHGDSAGALLEWEGARALFTRLGALPDARAAGRRVAEHQRSGAVERLPSALDLG